MPRRIILVVAGLAGAATAIDAVTAPSGARPSPPPAAPSAPLAEPVARCPPGFRRHTITAKCVRIQPRFPLLGWF